jgi:hypothetical protein
MMLPIEVRAEFLKTAMLEDRKEIRLLRDRIYQVSSLLTVSSFAITSFLAQRGPMVSRLFFLAVDGSFFALLWVSFLRLKRDLRYARRCLEAREGMIRNLGVEKPDDVFDPFPAIDLIIRPRITDNDLYWIVSFVSVALLAKLLLVCFRILGY